MGNTAKHEEYGNKLHYLNSTKQQFDWDNDEIENDEELVKDKPISHTIILAYLPGIELEKEVMDKPGPTVIECIGETHANHALADSANSNSPHTTGV